VDENWQSNVPGLCVVGENGAGIQGANRLSQNALAELLVSGSRAGKRAAQIAASVFQDTVDPREAEAATEGARQMLDNNDGIRPIILRNRLRQLMWEKVGVYRTESNLQSALKELEAMEELIEGLENHFLVTTAKCVAQGALLRTESRGAHYRDDYPKTDHCNWLQHLVMSRANGELKIEKVPVDLKEIRPEEEIT
jgi:succinate dehydrogenase/fumarate reductase flavoprotein subunit